MTFPADHPTLTQLVDKLRPLESCKVRALVVDPVTGTRSQVPQAIPAFLFRGESKVYPSICSSRHRFERDTRLSRPGKSRIDWISGMLDKLLRENGLGSMGSASLLQHYGFPTEVIDTTSSIDVAASFAVYRGDANQPGRILVYPTDKLKLNAVVIDLSMIDWARRPSRQHGFMIFHREYHDWQDQRLIDDVQVEEHRFVGSEQEREQFDQNSYLWGPPEKDPVSGLLHKLVHDVILAGSVEPKEIVDWLNCRIPWAPFPIRAVPGKDGPPEWEPDLDHFAEQLDADC